MKGKRSPDAITLRAALNSPPFYGDREAYFDAWIEYYEKLDEQEWEPDSKLTGAEQFR